MTFKGFLKSTIIGFTLSLYGCGLFGAKKVNLLISYNCSETIVANNLIDQYRLFSSKQLSEEYRNRGYIQTIGFGYETTNFEKNSIYAVYRAIDQSLRARNVVCYTDILGVLRNLPPLQLGVGNTYKLQVGIPANSQIRINYEVKVLEVKSSSTAECPVSASAVVATRYEDESYNAKFGSPDLKRIRYSESLSEGRKTLSDIYNDRLKEVLRRNKPKDNNREKVFASIDSLVFGDMFSLISEEDVEKEIDAIFLGKGIYAFYLGSTQVCKFGEERLFHLRVNTNSYWRPSELFKVEKYTAPESWLICLFEKFSSRKRQYSQLAL